MHTTKIVSTYHPYSSIHCDVEYYVWMYCMRCALLLTVCEAYYFISRVWLAHALFAAYFPSCLIIQLLYEEVSVWMYVCVSVWVAQVEFHIGIRFIIPSLPIRFVQVNRVTAIFPKVKWMGDSHHIGIDSTYCASILSKCMMQFRIAFTGIGWNWYKRAQFTAFSSHSRPYFTLYFAHHHLSTLSPSHSLTLALSLHVSDSNIQMQQQCCARAALKIYTTSPKYTALHGNKNALALLYCYNIRCIPIMQMPKRKEK